jgi:hypothetical protein
LFFGWNMSWAGLMSASPFFCLCKMRAQEVSENDGHVSTSTAASTGGKPMTRYAETYRRSLEQPEEFWAEAAEAIDWERRWDQVLDTSRPPFYRWFPGAALNTCWNARMRKNIP